MNLASQLAEVQVRGWSVKDKAEITGKATKAEIQDRMDLQKVGPEVFAAWVGKAQLPAPGPDGTISVVVKQPVISADEAKQVASSIMNYYSYGFVTGNGATHGDPFMRAGGMIEMKSVGERFEGLYYLTDVLHLYEHKGFTTFFEVYRPGITPNKKTVHPKVTPKPPPKPPTPPKTFFEFLAEGLKQIPLAQGQARSRRTTAPGYEKDYADTPLDGGGMIKKPSVDPGLYNVQLKEVVGGSWAIGDELPPPIDNDTHEKPPIEDLKLAVPSPLDLRKLAMLTASALNAKTYQILICVPKSDLTASALEKNPGAAGDALIWDSGSLNDKGGQGIGDPTAKAADIKKKLEALDDPTIAFRTYVIGKGEDGKPVCVDGPPVKFIGLGKA
ncbi:MAG: hypothetical protein ACRELB_25110, partial [Polyangiaceae bacterium]